MKNTIKMIQIVILSSSLAIIGWLVVGPGFSKIVDKIFILPNAERKLSLYNVIRIEPNATIFLGDSITAAGAWQELLISRAVYNRGIEGDVSSGVLKRLDKIVYAKPSKIFLMIGTNDLTDGYSINQVVQNINDIISLIHENSPETEVFVQSVLPREQSYQKEIEELNLRLEQSVARKATWIDLYPLFLDVRDGSINNHYSNDELHLLGEGYLLWINTLKPYL